MSCDLEMEHLNRLCKTAIGNYYTGANISDGTVSRVGKHIGEMSKVMHNFDEANHVSVDTSHHSVQSAFVDLKRYYTNFKKPMFSWQEAFKIRCNMLHKLDEKKLNKWMGTCLKK